MATSMWFSDSPRTLARAKTAEELLLRPTLESRDTPLIPHPPGHYESLEDAEETPLNVPLDKRGIKVSQFQWLLSKLKNRDLVSIPETVFLHKGVAQCLVYTETDDKLVFKGTSQKGGVLQLDPIIRDFLRLQRKRDMVECEIAAVRYMNDQAVRYIVPSELQVMLKNRRKGWIDVLFVQLVPWSIHDKPQYVSYSFNYENALNHRSQSNEILNICRNACITIVDQIFPPNTPTYVTSGEFDFVYIPSAETLWLVHVTNLKTKKRAPKLRLQAAPLVTQAFDRKMDNRIIDRDATLIAMLDRSVVLGATLTEYQRIAHEQKLLREAEESRNFKRGSVVVSAPADTVKPSQIADPKKFADIPMPQNLQGYLEKFRKIQAHYKAQITLIK